MPTVKRGDTLSAIARRAGVSLGALLAANPQISNPNLIRPGQNIRVPSRRVSRQEEEAQLNRVFVRQARDEQGNIVNVRQELPGGGFAGGQRFAEQFAEGFGITPNVTGQARQAPQVARLSRMAQGLRIDRGFTPSISGRQPSRMSQGLRIDRGFQPPQIGRQGQAGFVGERALVQQTSAPSLRDVRQRLREKSLVQAQRQGGFLRFSSPRIAELGRILQEAARRQTGGLSPAAARSRRYEQLFEGRVEGEGPSLQRFRESGGGPVDVGPLQEAALEQAGGVGPNLARALASQGVSPEETALAIERGAFGPARQAAETGGTTQRAGGDGATVPGPQGERSRQQLADARRQTAIAMFGGVFNPAYGPPVFPDFMSVDVAMGLPFDPQSEPMQQMFQETFGVTGFDTVQEFLDALGYQQDPGNPNRWFIPDEPVRASGYGGGAFLGGGGAGGRTGRSRISRGVSRGRRSGFGQPYGLVNWRIGL